MATEGQLAGQQLWPQGGADGGQLVTQISCAGRQQNRPLGSEQEVVARYQQTGLPGWLLRRAQPDAPVAPLRLRQALPDFVIAAVQPVFQQPLRGLEVHQADIRRSARRLEVDQPMPLADIAGDLGDAGEASLFAQGQLLGMAAGFQRGGWRQRLRPRQAQVGVQAGGLQPVHLAGFVTQAGRGGQQAPAPHAKIGIGNALHAWYSGKRLRVRQKAMS